MTITYYQDPDVRITSGGIETPDGWYPLRTLTYIWHERSGRLRNTGYVAATRIGAVGGVVLLVAGCGVEARHLHLAGNTSLLAIGITVLILAGGAAAIAVESLLARLDRSNARARGQHEIWIRTAEFEAKIYTTPDRTTFGQVYRALSRAVENIEAL